MTTRQASEFLGRLMQRAGGSASPDEQSGVEILQRLLGTVEEVELSWLSLKKPAPPKVPKTKAPKATKAPSLGSEEIHAEFRKLYDDSTALRQMTSKDVDGTLNVIVKGAKLADLKNAASRFVGSGLSKMSKGAVMDQVLSKILTKLGHIT